MRAQVKDGEKTNTVVNENTIKVIVCNRKSNGAYQYTPCDTLQGQTPTVIPNELVNKQEMKKNKQI